MPDRDVDPRIGETGQSGQTSKEPDNREIKNRELTERKIFRELIN